MFRVVGHPRVRALHTGPDAPPVDLEIDGTRLAVGLAFAEISDYLEIPAGRRQATAREAASGGSGAVLAHATVDLAPGRDYTLVTLGMLSQMQILPLVDSAPAPDSDHAMARALHASPDAPALDIGVRGGRLLFGNLAFGHVSPYLEVPAGTAHLEFRPAGQARSVASLPYHRFGGGDLHTFVVLGLLDGDPSLRVLPLIETVAMRLPS